jgi:hypothetical protein
LQAGGHRFDPGTLHPASLTGCGLPPGRARLRPQPRAAERPPTGGPCDPTLSHRPTGTQRHVRKPGGFLPKASTAYRVRSGSTCGNNRLVATPNATKIALLATLAFTAIALASFLRVVGDEIDPDLAAAFLLLFGLLFCVRVLGQLLVRAKAPRWLPPTEQWNLLPYRLLLPIQVVFVAVIAAVVVDFTAGPWFFAEPNRAFGRFLIGFSAVYAGSMVVRYAIRMALRPAERWFGGTIPMVFHIVLAAFLFVWGTYGASY